VRRTRPVGTTPCEALDAWQIQSGIFAGEIEAPEEEPKASSYSTTIRAAVESYLVDVKATKGGHLALTPRTSPNATVVTE
jgi:hypothetical protein